MSVTHRTGTEDRPRAARDGRGPHVGTDLTWRVRDKMFAVGGPESQRISVKASMEEQAELIAAAPQTYQSAAYVGRFGWVSVNLSTVDRRAVDRVDRRSLAAYRSEDGSWPPTTPGRVVQGPRTRPMNVTAVAISTQAPSTSPVMPPSRRVTWRPVRPWRPARRTRPAGPCHSDPGTASRRHGRRRHHAEREFDRAVGAGDQRPEAGRGRRRYATPAGERGRQPSARRTPPRPCQHRPPGPGRHIAAMHAAGIAMRQDRARPRRTGRPRGSS